MNTNKKDDGLEKWLDTLDGVERAKAPEFLYERTLERIKLSEKKIKSTQIIPMRVVWRVAAIFIGIAFLNIYCITHYMHDNTSVQKTISSADAVKEMYFSSSNLNL